MTRSRRWRRVIRLGFGITVTALGALVVVLGYQNETLREQLGVLRQVEMGLPYPGRVVPRLETEAVTSDTVRSTVIGGRGDGRAHVLFILRSTCPHCERTLPYWNAIAERIENEGLPADVFGLSKEPGPKIRRYVREAGAAFPIARFPDDRTAEMYGAIAVPITLIVDSNGRIAFARVGALTSQAAVDSVMKAMRETSTREPTVASSGGLPKPE